MTKVDVLVIGLGPAGCAAAAVAARAGLSVLAVERKARVGVPVQCAEFIPLPLGKYAQAESVQIQRIVGMKNYLPSGVTEAASFPGLIIDRAAVDQALAREAEAQGAQAGNALPSRRRNLKNQYKWRHTECSASLGLMESLTPLVFRRSGHAPNRRIS